MATPSAMNTTFGNFGGFPSVRNRSTPSHQSLKDDLIKPPLSSRGGLHRKPSIDNFQSPSLKSNPQPTSRQHHSVAGSISSLDKPRSNKLNVIAEEKQLKEFDQEPDKKPPDNMSAFNRTNRHMRHFSMEDIGDIPILFAPSTIISPNSSATSFRKTFMAFNELMTTHRSEVKNFTQDLTIGKNDRNHIKKQLAFNKSQQKLILQSLAQSELDSQRLMSRTLYNEKKKELQMPKIKVTPARNALIVGEKPNESTLTPHVSKLDTPKVESFEKRKRVRLSADNINALFMKHFKVFKCKEPENLSYRPEVREGGTFTIVGDFGYLYGGRSHLSVNHVDMVDLQTSIWTKIDPTGDHLPDGRAGHTVCEYDKNLVIFGGEKRFNNALKIRECLNDVWMLSLTSHEWKRQYCSGVLVEARRNHIAAIVGKYMLVHGGIDTYGNALSDLKVLNLQLMKWNSYTPDGHDETGIAFHTACEVFHPDRKKFELFKNPEQPNAANPLIKEEGIYVFGGKTEDGVAVNTLKVLKVFGKRLKWVTLQTTGQAPLPRFQHTMDYFAKMNCLIIYGGRNDHVPNGCLKDFGILWLEHLCWMQVSCLGQEIKGRFSHCAGIYDWQLCILGGMNYNTYLNPDIESIELDQSVVNRLQKEYGNQASKDTVALIRTQNWSEANSPSARHAFDDDIDNKIMSYLPEPTKEELKAEDEAERKFTRREKLRVYKAFFGGVRGAQLVNLLSPNGGAPSANSNLGNLKTPVGSNDTSRISELQSNLLRSLHSRESRNVKFLLSKVLD